MVDTSISNWISETASQLGFSQCGVVRAEKFPTLARNEEWLLRGYAGEMKYLHDARRGDPSSVMSGVRSVIVCALTYNTEHARTAQAHAGLAEETSKTPRGWISRYAWGDDYHDVLRAKLGLLLEGLRQQCDEPFEARIYADTGPIDERALARQAGLGWLGKNTLLLNEQHGSFFFLGAILTTLDLESSLEPGQFPPPDRCGTCRKCIDACPTEALVEPYVMDARKCISYLTIELRGTIPEELRGPMGQHILGCDICQDVCPWNRSAPVTQAKDFQPRRYRQELSEASPGESREPSDRIGVSDTVEDSLFLPRLEWLAAMPEEEFRRMFRGSPIKRTKWKGLMRNVCIALGNSKTGEEKTRQRILALLYGLATSSEPVISESAQWAIPRIQEMTAGVEAV